jgi:hypothetical protein
MEGVTPFLEGEGETTQLGARRRPAGGGEVHGGVLLRPVAAVDQEEGDDWDWAAWAAKSSGLGEK